MTQIETARTVAELVTERPARARILEELGIDYCCGGKATLAAVCADRGLDARAVAEMLAVRDDGDGEDTGPEWQAVSIDELCRQIVERHHAYARQEAPRLVDLLGKLVAAHADRHPELIELRRLLESLAEELGVHMLIEESVLFPAICALSRRETSGFTTIAEPILAMEADHAVSGALLERMRALAGGYEPPADACNTYRVALDGLAAFEHDLRLHVHKENNVLFPRALALEAELQRRR